MASYPKQQIYLKRENDKGVVQGWTYASMQIDPMAGQVAFTPRGLLAGKWSITLRPELVSAFQIEMISDVSTLAVMYGGGLIGYAIALFMSRWVKMPALKFEQQTAPIGERQVTIRAVGFQPRKKTRQIANQLADLLRERGAKVMLPDLVDDEAWKFPWMPVLVGLALLVIVLIGLFVCVAVVASSGSSS